MKKQTFLLLIAAAFLSLPAFAQIPSYVPTTGLVGWYEFKGNANDGSTLANHGMLIPGYEPTLESDRFGNANSAYRFDGVDDYIWVGNAPLVAPPITISAWVKFDFLLKSCILGLGEIGTSYCDKFYFAGAYGSYGEPSVGSFGDYHFSANNSLDLVKTGEWVHLVVVFERSGDYVVQFVINNVSFSASAQIDGGIDDCSTGNIGQAFNNTGFDFGKHTGRSSVLRMDGIIDDVGIWNRLLTADEIEGLFYASINAGFESNESANSVSIYPNPASDYIELKLQTTVGGEQYSIIDQTGRVITSGILSEGKARIETSEMASGMYLVCINGSPAGRFCVMP